jgi:hypothetical protein
MATAWAHEEEKRVSGRRTFGRERGEGENYYGPRVNG